MLIGERLSKRYGGAVALENVNIAVHPGKVTAVIGPSGSGKTSLVRGLSLLVPPDSGRITLDGTTYDLPVARTIVPPPWPTVTVVFQQLFLWPHLTLRENILLGTHRRGHSVGLLEEMIGMFGMHQFVDRHPNEVSVGQRQRAALARAVALRPTYILLDEITSALDVEQTSVILDYLLTLRERGIGLLVVTHMLNFVRRLLAKGEGDQVAFMDEGRILEIGGLEILDTPTHTRLRKFLSSAERAA